MCRTEQLPLNNPHPSLRDPVQCYKVLKQEWDPRTVQNIKKLGLTDFSPLWKLKWFRNSYFERSADDSEDERESDTVDNLEQESVI